MTDIDTNVEICGSIPSPPDIRDYRLASVA
jgi:hypothetical protein